MSVAILYIHFLYIINLVQTNPPNDIVIDNVLVVYGYSLRVQLKTVDPGMIAVSCKNSL